MEKETKLERADDALTGMALLAPAGYLLQAGEVWAGVAVLALGVGLAAVRRTRRRCQHK